MIAVMKGIGDIFIFIMVLNILKNNALGKSSIPDGADMEAKLSNLWPWLGAAAVTFFFHDMITPSTSVIIPLVGGLFMDMMNPVTGTSTITSIVTQFVEFFGVLLAMRTLSKNAAGKNSLPDATDADSRLNNVLVWILVAAVVWAALQFSGVNSAFVNLVGGWITKILSGDVSGTLMVLRLI